MSERPSRAKSQLVLSPIVDRRVHIKNLVEMVKFVLGILIPLWLN